MHRAVLAVALAACATNDVVDTVYDPCSPLTVALAPDAAAEEREGVAAAIAGWASVLPATIAIGSGARAANVLPIWFESDAPYRGMYWDEIGAISINVGGLRPEDYPVAIAHELGHAFGLLHVPASERTSVMNVGNVEVPPTGDDAAAVRARWASCAVEAARTRYR